jgi:hypothetical protein
VNNAAVAKSDENIAVVATSNIMCLDYGSLLNTLVNIRNIDVNAKRMPKCFRCPQQSIRSSVTNKGPSQIRLNYYQRPFTNKDQLLYLLYLLTNTLSPNS